LLSIFHPSVFLELIKIIIFIAFTLGVKFPEFRYLWLSHLHGSKSTFLKSVQGYSSPVTLHPSKSAYSPENADLESCTFFPYSAVSQWNPAHFILLRNIMICTYQFLKLLLLFKIGPLDVNSC